MKLEFAMQSHLKPRISYSFLVRGKIKNILTGLSNRNNPNFWIFCTSLMRSKMIVLLIIVLIKTIVILSSESFTTLFLEDLKLTSTWNVSSCFRSERSLTVQSLTIPFSTFLAASKFLCRIVSGSRSNRKCPGGRESAP